MNSDACHEVIIAEFNIKYLFVRNSETSFIRDTLKNFVIMITFCCSLLKCPKILLKFSHLLLMPQKFRTNDLIDVNYSLNERNIKFFNSSKLLWTHFLSYWSLRISFIEIVYPIVAVIVYPFWQQNLLYKSINTLVAHVMCLSVDIISCRFCDHVFSVADHSMSELSAHECATL